MEKTRTRFGSILKSLMEEKGITAVTLSKMIRVHRTDVPHYISGTRQPADQEKIQQICEVMMLSPEDTHTLLDAWKVDRIGIDLYERRMYVHRFLSNLNEVLQRPEIFDLSASSEEAGIPAAFPNYEDTDTEQKIPALRRLFGVSELTEAMMLLLLEETRGEKSEVLLLAQPDLDFPMNLFSTIITRNPDCSIRHILCLENSKRNRNGLVNLEYLNRMLPSLSSVNYQPVYCYYSINDVFSSMNILPCVLVTEKRVLLFSKNCKEGLLVSDNTITEFYREKFRELFAKCIPMAEKVPDPRGILDFYRPHLDSLHDCLAFDIAEQPCFLPPYPDEIAYPAAAGLAAGSPLVAVNAVNHVFFAGRRQPDVLRLHGAARRIDHADFDIQLIAPLFPGTVPVLHVSFSPLSKNPINL